MHSLSRLATVYGLATRLARILPFWVLSLTTGPYLETRLNRKLRKSPPFPRRCFFTLGAATRFRPLKNILFQCLAVQKNRIRRKQRWIRGPLGEPFPGVFWAAFTAQYSSDKSVVKMLLPRRRAARLSDVQMTPTAADQVPTKEENTLRSTLWT